MHAPNAKNRHLPVLNETFRFPIPRTTMTIFLQDYGDHLVEHDIYACLQEAGVYIVRQIILHGDGRMPAKSWSLNHVVLEFMPQSELTLMRAAEVVDALEGIVLEHHWTFATQVRVFDASLGWIGNLNIGYKPRPSASVLLAHTWAGNFSSQER